MKRADSFPLLRRESGLGGVPDWPGDGEDGGDAGATASG
jgi:hypothetical protein